MLSIIIPAYNASAYLERTLGAVESFDSKNAEVIVVDDASTDGTSEVAKRYAVKVIQLKENKGPAVARNVGARAAKGDILLFCDADVVLPKNTPQVIEEFFKRHPDVSVFSGVYAIDKTEKNIFSKYRNFKERHEELSRVTTTSACRSSILGIKKETFSAVGGFNEKWLSAHCEDAIFCNTLLKNNIKIFINSEFEAFHLKRYNAITFLKQAFKRTIAVYYAMRRIGSQFMGQYYKKDSRLTLILEVSAPFFIMFFGFAFFYFKITGLLFLSILFLFIFVYAQKDFYLYTQRIFGKRFIFVFFILRFVEVVVSELALASVVIGMGKNGIKANFY